MYLVSMQIRVAVILAVLQYVFLYEGVILAGWAFWTFIAFFVVHFVVVVFEFMYSAGGNARALALATVASTAGAILDFVWLVFAVCLHLSKYSQFASTVWKPSSSSSSSASDPSVKLEDVQAWTVYFPFYLAFASLFLLDVALVRMRMGLGKGMMGMGAGMGGIVGIRTEWARLIVVETGLVCVLVLSALHFLVSWGFGWTTAWVWLVDLPSVFLAFALGIAIMTSAVSFFPAPNANAVLGLCVFSAAGALASLFLALVYDAPRIEQRDQSEILTFVLFLRAALIVFSLAAGYILYAYTGVSVFPDPGALNLAFNTDGARASFLPMSMTHGLTYTQTRARTSALASARVPEAAARREATYQY